MNEDAGDGIIGHGQFCGLPVLHGKVVGRGVQLEALRALRLHGVVAAVLQGHKDAAGFPGGHGVHQSVVRHPANFKGHAGQPLRLVRGTDLDDLHAAHGVVVEPECLGVVGVDGDGLALGVPGRW